MDSPIPNPESQQSSTAQTDIPKLQALLKAKDDTQRFVGLALLKSVVDNTPEVRQDEAVIQSLWDSLSPKFLDRLIRTGSKPASKSQNAKEMLDLAVSVLHTFAVLLPERAGSDAKFLDRIPGLVSAALHSSEETTVLLLQLLHTLVSSQEGAKVFVKIQDTTSLTEIASKHAPVLDIFTFAWLNAMTVIEDTAALSQQVDITIQSLVSTFKGTDAVTLLEFLGYFLRNADSRIVPLDPKWLKTVINYIQNLVTSRPTPEARSAYTNAAASLLQIYPNETCKLLFTSQQKDETAFSYLLINLLLIDIRSSAPTLLEQLNKPEYPKASRRLASAFDVISIFVGYLIQCLEDDSSDTFPMPPSSLLKLRKGISETMSVTIEYLRDRWDASVAGAMGLHPEAVVGTAKTASGTHHTLAWDSMKDHADEDMLILSAVRTLALWLREEENDTLRKETTGLMDMFMDLYKSSSQDKLDFRSPILVALEGIITILKGRASLIEHNGWSVLTKDLLTILPSNQSITTSRGTDIIRVLLPLVEEESGVPEEWMDLITGVAAWDLPDSEDEAVLEFQVAVLQLSSSILARAGVGMRRRYAHSIAAINGIANVLGKKASRSKDLDESLEDVIGTLAALRVNPA